MCVPLAVLFAGGSLRFGHLLPLVFQDSGSVPLLPPLSRLYIRQPVTEFSVGLDLKLWLQGPFQMGDPPDLQKGTGFYEHGPLWGTAYFAGASCPLHQTSSWTEGLEASSHCKTTRRRFQQR